MKKTIRKHSLILTLLPVLTLVSFLLPGMAQAAIVTYNLSNHSGSGDGLDTETTQQFGLRLDGLLGGGENENYIFDFDHGSSSMKLIWDDTANTIQIVGTRLWWRR